MAFFNKNKRVAVSDQAGYANLRRRMVEEQIAERGVTDARVLEAMETVERHRFVPREAQASSYDDRALAIGHGQTISQPYIVAAMVEALALTGGERVLEIGTGSGYQAAVLSMLAESVDTVERIPHFAELAESRLRELGYSNVRVHRGDGSLGWPGEGRYDGIVVAAASPRVPEGLLEQLAPEGRLVCPVGDRETQTLTVVRRANGDFESEERFRCAFVPLLGADAWPEPKEEL